MYSKTEHFNAIGMMMARYAQANASTMDADGVIESAPLQKVWKPGTMTAPATYERGDIRSDENQPWKCNQTHTHHGEGGWNPAATRALWSPYHAKTVRNALPYVAPTNAEDAYNTGEWMIWTDGLRYKAKSSAVVYGPDVLPDAWEVEAS